MLANDEHRALDHFSPYPPRDHHAFPFNAPGLSDEARRVRNLVAGVFATGGMTNYPSEYWHWSYGDQGWAYRGGHPHAIYGSAIPDKWEPDPADLTDDPLIWLPSDR